MLEKELQKGVVDVAKILGYRVHHTRAAWTNKGYRTPIIGHVGFPDLVISGHGRCLFVELKCGKNVLSAEQAAWLEALRAAGQEAYVWTEHEWASGEIEAELKRSTKHESAAA
jgi:hypothetical protein